MTTGRQCHLVRLRDKPVRDIVMQVRDWMIVELNADIVAVDKLYPDLGLQPESWAQI
ncbi:hypothetical protein [Agrobacterium cavarae]|uniref:hypothetical protein n=1 Tax=Agrobacterium cavarae TaxID=2528239 RepID=UPI00289835DD|nr:hypothetical protein [Agrobacterium cavarae]